MLAIEPKLKITFNKFPAPVSHPRITVLIRNPQNNAESSRIIYIGLPSVFDNVYNKDYTDIIVG